MGQANVRRLYFGNLLLIIRLSFGVPILFLYHSYISCIGFLFLIGVVGFAFVMPIAGGLFRTSGLLGAKTGAVGDNTKGLGRFFFLYYIIASFLFVCNTKSTTFFSDVATAVALRGSYLPYIDFTYI